MDEYFKEMLILSSKNGDEYDCIKKWYTTKDWSSEIRSLERQKKSDRHAQVIKNMGNAIYALRDFPSAIKLYMRALMFANYNSATYGTILANISGCLYELELYKKCVMHIDACFSTSYPNKSRPKLYVRKIKALRRLGELSCVAETILQFEKFLGKSKISLADKVKYRELAQESLSETNIYEDIVREYIFPEFIENPRILNVCESATLKYNKKYGRHIVAQKPIMKGDCILMEKPYASIGHAKCPNCFKYIKTIIPCDNCPDFMYCSKVCREQDDEIHRWECRFYQLEKFRSLDGRVRLAFRIFLKGLQGGYKTNLKKIEEELNFGDKTDNFPYVQQMYRSFSQISPLDKTVYLDGCCILLACINTENNLKEWIGSKIGNDMYLIGKNLLQLMSNCSGNNIAIRNSDGTVSFQLHPSFSFSNHTCVPNTSVCKQDDMLVLRALKDICPNEQIYVNYLEGTMIETTGKNRQDEIFRRLGFTCHCVLCTSENQGMLPCPKCKLYSEFTGNGLVNCRSCGTTRLNWNVLLKIRTLINAVTIYEAGNDINVLHEGIKILQEMQINPNHHFIISFYIKYIIECVRAGKLYQSANCLQYVQNIQFLRNSPSLSASTMIGVLKVLIKKMWLSSEWQLVKYKKSTLIKYEKFLEFLHEYFSLCDPIVPVLKDIKHLQMFFSIQKQIIEFEDLCDWVN